MKITTNWLKEHLDTKLNENQIINKLTDIGLEVESVDSQSGELDSFIVAKILKAEKHPDADRLRVCDVDIGSGDPVKVVCGAPNANEGCIAFSPDGQTMVFAKGNSGRKKGAEDVDIYVSRFRRGTWSTPTLMRVSKGNSWDSTPSFSRDGRTLYFSSTRRGYCFLMAGPATVNLFAPKSNFLNYCVFEFRSELTSANQKISCAYMWARKTTIPKPRPCR